MLLDEGYDIEVRHGHLLLKGVPYVNAERQVKIGTLVTVLQVNGDRTGPPHDHTLFFIGEHPCNADGSAIEPIRNASRKQELAPGLTVDHRFSAKPRPSGKYRDYHHQLTTYAGLISGPARQIDPDASAQTTAIESPAAEESPFVYTDTSSTRSGIAAVTAKLRGQTIAIAGCGGTGSYVLDLIAKTPVAAIHLYDGDVFANHNAFRSPGAASLDDLNEHPMKVEHLRSIYARMHRGVHAHAEYLTEDNLEGLRDMDFVFICLDRGRDKRMVVEKLTAWGKAFVDVGVGVEMSGDALRGQVRVTTSTPEKRDHLDQRVSFAGGIGEDDYSSNIQIAELNALNASLAVIKWKKLMGFYQDLDHEHHCLYTINGNAMCNEDAA
jgi:hypothetical protein